MSFSSLVTRGAGIGFVTGLAGSAFFGGLFERGDKNGNDSAIGAGIFALGCFISGPFVGATAGAGLYGMKKSVQHLRGAPRSIKVPLGASMGALIVSAIAYKVGKG